MKYYIRTYHDGLNVVGGGVWKVEANSATRIDVSVSDLSICNATAGLDIISSLKNQFPGSQFYELKLAPGEYHPRIARPSSSNPTEPLGNNPDSGDNRAVSLTSGTSTGDSQLMERVRFLRAGLVTPLPGGLGIDPSGITTGVPGAWLKRNSKRR